MFHVVLVEPEIPQNTGNIARTCAAADCRLHLVHPLGFEINDRQLRRAGLDYWPLLGVREYPNIGAFFAENRGGRFFFSSTKAGQVYTQPRYRDGDFLVFGKETAGLPEALLRENPGSCVRIPMIPEARSLNLSNAVAVVVYEALRQGGFAGLKPLGKFAAPPTG